MSVRPPAPRPCESCPYRQGVPSGIWAREEYLRLPPYDFETFEQPPGTFMCHQQDERICAGWLACHDRVHLLALRLLLPRMAEDEAVAVLEYETDVPVFASGQEACVHGLRDVLRPGPDAVRLMRKIERRQGEQEGLPVDRRGDLRR